MPRSPSIVPEETDRDIYIVLDDFGPLGRAWRETDGAQAGRKTLVRDLFDGIHMIDPSHEAAWFEGGSFIWPDSEEKQAAASANCV
jgi:hypothetical protein